MEEIYLFLGKPMALIGDPIGLHFGMTEKIVDIDEAVVFSDELDVIIYNTAVI
ncbi:MAG: hypothetical protein ACYS0I_10570 [Planctomycetota bacterium]